MLNGPQHLRNGAAKPCAVCDGNLVSLVLLVASDGAVYAAWHGGERDSGRPILLLANSSLFKEVFLRLKPPDDGHDLRH
jgi:hypothetical protein